MAIDQKVLKDYQNNEHKYFQRMGLVDKKKLHVNKVQWTIETELQSTAFERHLAWEDGLLNKT